MEGAEGILKESQQSGGQPARCSGPQRQHGWEGRGWKGRALWMERQLVDLRSHKRATWVSLAHWPGQVLPRTWVSRWKPGCSCFPQHWRWGGGGRGGEGLTKNQARATQTEFLGLQERDSNG